VNANSLEILSAFIDGEPVDPAALAAALVSPGGREALLDFARLRSAIAADETQPSPEFHRRMHEVLDATRGGGWRIWNYRRFAAAAVLALAAAGLLDVGVRLRRPAVEQPPRPDRVFQFEPGIDWKVTSK
jgi:hypothetical protein